MDFMAYHNSNLGNRLEHSLLEKLNIILNVRMIVDYFKERLPEMLFDGLNLKLLYFVHDIKKKMPKLIKKALNSNIPSLLKQSLNIVHKDINVLNKLDARRISPTTKINKGKSIATPSDDLALKTIMSLMEQSAQLMEKYNRLANLKKDNKESGKALENMNLSWQKAKQKDYLVKNKKTTMIITRNNQALNFKVYSDFKLKVLGFSECVKLHALASKRIGKHNT
nr:hypothetical protein [Tanacetum cinerariifolium]